MTSERLIDFPAACAIVGLKRSTVYALIAAGKFPRIVKCGRKTLFAESHILQWVQDRIEEAGATE